MKRIAAIVLLSGLFCTGLAVSGYTADGGALFARCARCHGDRGDKPPHILKGQDASVLLEKLNGYAAGTFGGEKKNVMQNMVKGLSEEDRQALASHIARF